MRAIATAVARPPMVAFLLIAAMLATILTAHALVPYVYQGYWLPNLFTNRAIKPVTYYLGTVDRLILTAYALAAAALGAWRASRYPAVARLLVPLQRTRVLVVALVTIDVIFCIVSERYHGVFDVRLDGGFPEFFQYAQELAAGFTLFAIFRTTGRPTFRGWALLFFFFFLDDAFEYHEHAGAWLGEWPLLGAVGAAFDVRGSDIGELVSFVPVLVGLVLSLAGPYCRETRDGRAVTHRLAVLLACLVAVGGVLDLLDQVAVTVHSNAEGIVSLLEDGGEMIVMSVMLGYAVQLRRRLTPARPQSQADRRTRAA